MKLTPTFMFAHYYDITPEFLQSHGIRALLIDIDNTLAPYEQELPDERLHTWLQRLREAGIRVALVSNNHAPRVEKFNEGLGLPAYADSRKPFKKNMLRAMRELNVSARETAILGDQLLTDAYAGLRLGLPALIVPPIRDKTNLFFRFKRWCERPFIRRYAKRNGWQEWMSFWHVKNRKQTMKHRNQKQK